MNSQPHGPPPGPFDRERDIEDHNRHRAIEEDLLHRQRMEREREQNERHERERHHREQYQPAPPHQNSAGSIPLHQPVASRLPGAISPGGLLANHGGAPPSGPLGAPSGPGNAFGGPLHGEARPIQHNPQQATSQLQQQQGFGPNIMQHNSVGGPGGNAAFGGPLQQQQAQQQQQQQQAAQQQQQQQQEAASRLQQALPFGGPIPQGHQMAGAPALGQAGQQPILNVSLRLVTFTPFQCHPNHHASPTQHICPHPFLCHCKKSLLPDVVLSYCNLDCVSHLTRPETINWRGPCHFQTSQFPPLDSQHTKEH